MGGSSKQTVGYWYKYCIQFGLGFGPVDAFLEFRGGDRPAWVGRATGNQSLTVSKPNLWGGEKDGEGGIDGTLDLRFGAEDQAPSPTLISAFGGMQSAHRGKFTSVFRGKYGARNPYPKPCSFKFEHILAGRDWYPEKAVVPVGGDDTGILVTAMAIVDGGIKSSPDNSDWSRAPVVAAGGGLWLIGLGDRYVTWTSGTASYTLDGETWTASAGTLGSSGGHRGGVYFKGVLIVAGGNDGIFTSDDKGVSFEGEAAPKSNWLAASPARAVLMSHYQNEILYTTDPHGVWETGIDPELYPGAKAVAFGGGVFLIGGKHPTDDVPKLVSTVGGLSVSDITLPAFASATTVAESALAFGNGIWVAGTDSGEIAFRGVDGVWHLATDALGGPCSALSWVNDRFYMSSDTGNISKQSFDGDHWSVISMVASQVAGSATLDTRDYKLRAMNPAHILYDSITSRPETGGQGEPTAAINNASFVAAADRLWAEGFGLCTLQRADETAEDFQQRICTVIGARLNQSRVDGLYYLDLIRGDYDFDSLPIIHERDCLEITKEPSDLREAVNQVLVEWFDPEAKEDRTTSPVQSLGAIQCAGGVISETYTWREIPVESLAIRAAKRELDAKAKPLSRFTQVTNRVAYDLRPGLYFRFQAPSEGIGDMVCLAGDIEDGELTKGSIRIVSVQDVFAMPDTVYVGEEPGADPGSDSTPHASPHQRAIELPYIELAQAMQAANLAALPMDVGFLGTLATLPAGNSLNYQIYSGAGEEDLVDHGSGEWCPTALVVESAGPQDEAFTLTEAELLERVVVGSWALWGDEIVRVDAIDATGFTATLARGCGDTVPALEHAAGERIYFCGDWVSSDQRQYAGGESVHAKLLTRAGAVVLDPGLAPNLTVTMDDRAARPYAPGKVRINGENRPAEVDGAFAVTYALRDRVLQADMVVDTEASSIGTSASNAYALRFLDGDGELLVEKLDMGGDSAAVELAYTGAVTMQLYAVNEVGDSWQAHVWTFDYTEPPGITEGTIDAPTYAPVVTVIDGGEVEP